jgi:hypothetical protein
MELVVGMQDRELGWDTGSIALAASWAVLPLVVPTTLVLETLAQLTDRVVWAFAEPGAVNYNAADEVSGTFQAVLDAHPSMGPWCVDQAITYILARLDAHSAAQAE